jgi:hypothetical protein
MYAQYQNIPLWRASIVVENGADVPFIALLRKSSQVKDRRREGLHFEALLHN